MKQAISILSLFLVALLLAVPSFGAATLTSTTLSAAVTTTSAVTIRVTSATDFVAGNYAYTNGELMEILSVNGLAIQVRRGASPTYAATHASGATIYVGAPRHFKTSAGQDKYGGTSCVAASELILPIVNAATRNVFDCQSSKWVVINGPAAAGVGLTALGPVTAGNITAGSALLPWQKLYVGTAATNNMVITPASTGAARVITMADPGAAANLAYTNSTNAQTITTTTKFGDSSAPTKMLAVSLAGATAAKTSTLTFAHTDDRAITFPDAAITVAGTVAYVCGTVNACSPALKPSMQIVQGITAALDGASPSTAAVTGLSPAFTGTTTYSCTGTLEGNTAATAAKGLAVTNVSGSAFTFYSANGANEKIHYTCIGY